MAARFIIFLCLFIILSAMEHLRPRKKGPSVGLKRKLANLMLIAAGSVLVWVLIPGGPVSTALLASQKGWSLLALAGLGQHLQVIFTIIAFDLLIYLQHVLFHAVPLLWRLHMVHHSDIHLDCTTGLRFHPAEILLSGAIKAAAAAALGPPVIAVVIFEVVLNSMSMFSHSNLALPQELDRLLRIVLVTPDMHRVHHSVIIRETNSNFGFNLSVWDRLFGTYVKRPALGLDGTPIGLSQYQKNPPSDLQALLVLPFTGDPGSYSLSGHGKTLKTADKQQP